MKAPLLDLCGSDNLSIEMVDSDWIPDAFFGRFLPQSDDEVTLQTCDLIFFKESRLNVSPVLNSEEGEYPFSLSSFFPLNDSQDMSWTTASSASDSPMKDTVNAWLESVHHSLTLLQTSGPTTLEVTANHFRKAGNRYSVHGELLALCGRLPWFRYWRNDRFRQTLAEKTRNGITLRHVIAAMNSLFRRVYSAQEIELIREYFINMEIPELRYCLTTIVEVCEEIDSLLQQPQLKDERLWVGGKRSRSQSNLEEAHQQNYKALRSVGLTEVQDVLSENGNILRSHHKRLMTSEDSLVSVSRS